MRGITGHVQYQRHFLTQAVTKGFTADQIETAIRNPERVTEVTKKPWQRRYIGAGVAIIMDGNRAVTLYADRIVTPLREDQRNDPEALASHRLATVSH